MVGLGGLSGALGQDLDHAPIELAERATERDALLVRRQPRRHGLAVRAGVGGRVRRAPAPGAGVHRRPQQVLHHRDLVGVRRAVPRGLVQGGQPQGIVTDERHEVHTETDVDRLEVLVEGLPRPRQHGAERPHRQVLDAAERGEHRLAVLGAQRRQREPAVAHERRRHAVPDGGRAEPVPERLGVVVGVQIDDPRGHEEAVGVDGPRGRGVHPADLRDGAILHRDVGAIA